jgi:4-carboxymuconolactone decarboxylase
MRELAVATAARECDCAYEWAAHVPAAKAAGVNEATLDIVGRKAALDGLPENEQRLLRYVRELVRTHRVSDETFAAMHKELGDRGIAELTASIGYYSLLACVLNAFEVAPPEGASALPAEEPR